MTVNVGSNGNYYSGTSIIEVRLKRQFQFLLEVPRVATEVTGEAVFVNLGDGRNVIALLAAGRDIDYAKYLVAKHFNLSYEDRDLAKFPKLEGRWELAGDELPTFLTFTDLNDATTSHLVPAGNFAEQLGVGTRLLNVTVEMTKAPVTTGIEQKLPWWNRPFPQPKPAGFRWDKSMFKRES